MHVVATAGHVDHGKSTLVRALTGMEPDRLEEERRRGLSIELGYCWTRLEEAGDAQLAFVDVPGHERFVSTMLAGVGPVPAVLLVVAADDPWMPQAAEHLAVADALGVRHGLVAVTRSDLADPGPMVRRATAELSATGLAGRPVVAVSGRTGEGLPVLRKALGGVLAELPRPDARADVRLWVDRRFTVRGAGTVVTGTLAAGRVRVGDRLESGEGEVRVRGIESLGSAADEVGAVARVALNVAGDAAAGLARHAVLTTPGAWHWTGTIDVRVVTDAAAQVPERPLLHVGSVAVPVRARALDRDVLRVRTERPLPLRVADRALLRDPGSRLVWGVEVLDPAPPPLRRRGDARARVAALAAQPAGFAAVEVQRRGLVSVGLLRRLGVAVPPGLASQAVDGWLLADDQAARLRSRLRGLVEEADASSDRRGIAAGALADRLELPTPRLLDRLLEPPLRLVEGRVTGRVGEEVPEALRRSVDAVLADLADAPYAAPSADRLREVGLDKRGVAAAHRAGLLLHVGDGVVLAPGADERASAVLAGLPQPFTTSEARQRLGTSRRVVLPLLAHLDRTRRTRRLPDDRRSVVARP